MAAYLTERPVTCFRVSRVEQPFAFMNYIAKVFKVNHSTHCGVLFSEALSGRTAQFTESRRVNVPL